MTTRTYTDFACTKTCPSEWREQAEKFDNVKVTLNEYTGHWVREIRGVKGDVRKDGWFYPEPGQLVTYRQATPTAVGIHKP